mmetsp:Transcript_63872/g.126274  ORF Transcript_63872/g.126274 Transcript_63872/m.126274 type:complete len:231 (+) Transcript_63872:421-1113(+)
MDARPLPLMVTSKLGVSPGLMLWALYGNQMLSNSTRSPNDSPGFLGWRNLPMTCMLKTQVKLRSSISAPITEGSEPSTRRMGQLWQLKSKMTPPGPAQLCLLGWSATRVGISSAWVPAIITSPPACATGSVASAASFLLHPKKRRMTPIPWRACSTAGFSRGLRPTERVTSSESSQIEIGSSVILFSETSSFLSDVRLPILGGMCVIMFLCTSTTSRPVMRQREGGRSTS